MIKRRFSKAPLCGSCGLPFGLLEPERQLIVGKITALIIETGEIETGRRYWPAKYEPLTRRLKPLHARIRALIRELDTLRTVHFVASSKRRKFHLPERTYGGDILNGQATPLWFCSRSAARDSGRWPCYPCLIQGNLRSR